MCPLVQLSMLKSKIHRATVTQAQRDYVGSITIDQSLMDAAGILEYERLQVADTIIIMCYCQLDAAEAAAHRPRVVFVDGNNAISRVTSYERHGRLRDMA